MEYATKHTLSDPYLCFLLKDINTEYHHFMDYRNSLLINLLVLFSHSFSSSQRDSTKTEIRPCVFNGCYCPVDKASSPYCFSQWSACSGPMFLLSLISMVMNFLHFLQWSPCLWAAIPAVPLPGPLPTTSRVLTLTHTSVIALALTSSRNDAWWS